MWERPACAWHGDTAVSMPRRLGPKPILSRTILIVAIPVVSGDLNFGAQKRQLGETMVLGADELSRSITGATWQFKLDDDRKALCGIP